jgi:hypothetical protein
VRQPVGDKLPGEAIQCQGGVKCRAVGMSGESFAIRSPNVGKTTRIKYNAVLEDYMGDRKTIVITTYGHNKTIDRIAVSLFETSEDDYYIPSPDAETYCDTINTLELKGDSWVFAKILSENTQYELWDVLFPLKFSDVIMKLDDMTIQKILGKVKFREIAMSLKDQDKRVQDKIFANMSKKASKMLEEEMMYIGPTRLQDVKRCQEKIIKIVRHLEQCGEIVIPYFKEGAVE